MQSIGILGGSFNPPHIAHLRLALEVQEQLSLTRIDLLPAALPPHKQHKPLLSFDVRVRLLRDAIQGLPGIHVNEMEAGRRGPAYTYDTLQEYQAAHPESQLFFIMGSEDLVQFSSWYKAARLPELAHLVIVCRGEVGRSDAHTLLAAMWPQSRKTPSGWMLSKETREVFFLTMPRLDISSSMIRQAWLREKSVRYLVPESVENYLKHHAREVAGIWGKAHDVLEGHGRAG